MRANNSPRRPRQHCSHRLLRSDLAGDNSSRRLHDIERPAVLALNRRFQATNVLSSLRCQISIHHDGSRPLILPKLRQNLMRNRNRQSGTVGMGLCGSDILVRQICPYNVDDRGNRGRGSYPLWSDRNVRPTWSDTGFSQCSRHSSLILGVRKREKQRNRNTLRPARSNPLSQLSQHRLARREQNFPFRAHSLPHPKPQLRRHDARRRGRHPVIKVLSRLPANGNCVLESLSGHECNSRTFALEQGIGTDGCPVTNFKPV